MVDRNTLKDSFLSFYGSEPRLFRAPGRVNLIGEHTDYNDGFVLPMAIDYEAVVAAAARDDRLVSVRSLDLDESSTFDLDRPGPPRRGVWLDYVEGVAAALEAGGARLKGANLLVQSSVPIGGGLSSSAALEVSVGLALVKVSGVEVDKRALALAGQQAEHNYVGIRSGIMDQLTSALGRAGHALLIDCRSLDSVEIPLSLPDVSIAVCDTRVKHALASSEYNLRRAECERGVEILREVMPDVRALRDLSPEVFKQFEDRLPEPIRRRCRHVVMENARTLAAAEALRSGDTRRMGELMAESHHSLRDDYEVSSAELDLMVEIARSLDSVFGARMTGGGFGGCTVNLVRRDALDSFRARIFGEYTRQTGYDPAVYVVEASDGAREIA